MILNIKEKDIFEENGTIILNRNGIASRAVIPASVVDKLMCDISTSGVIITPCRADKSLHFEEPTNEEYGVVITDNFGVGLQDTVSIDIITMGSYVYIEVYGGKIYFKGQDGNVYSVDTDGKVNKYNGETIYWFNNAVEYLTDTIGRIIELKYGLNCSMEDAVNNIVASLELTAKKDGTAKAKYETGIINENLAIFIKLVNVSVAVGIGDFTLENGVDREEFKVTDIDYYDDDDDSLEEDLNSEEEKKRDNFNRIDITVDDYIDDDEDWD